VVLPGKIKRFFQPRRGNIIPNKAQLFPELFLCNLTVKLLIDEVNFVGENGDDDDFFW
jgi:hypothetical protein